MNESTITKKNKGRQDKDMNTFEKLYEINGMGQLLHLSNIIMTL